MAHIPRRWLGLLAAPLLMGLCGVAYAEKPAITFVAVGGCGSAPQPSTLSAHAGSITIVNATGVAGTVELDSVIRQDLGAGMAVNAGLTPGRHLLRFLLPCSGSFAPATIDIGESPGAAPPPTTTSPSTVPTGVLTSTSPAQPPVAQRTTATRVAEMAFSTPSAATIAPRSSSAESAVGVLPVTDDGGVFFSDPYPVGDTGRDRNLLVVIALICVLGVSTAIIRVIVAQRTDRVIRGRQTQ
jgi:hypothetical protein